MNLSKAKCWGYKRENGRLTAAEALGHREFVLTRLYEGAKTGGMSREQGPRLAGMRPTAIAAGRRQ